MSVTLFKSTSSNTMNGEWPLSSIVTLWTLSAACLSINFPTLVEPVIDIFFMISEEINSLETWAGSPDSKLITPLGTPARLQISTSSITHPGVITSGLTITEHPAAKAVEIFLDAKITGKFQGTNAATTPTGS